MEQKRRTPIEGGPTFSMRHRVVRVLWRVSWAILCSWTPAMAWRWRRLVLVAFGAQMHPLSDVRGSAQVWLPTNLKMGKRALLSDGVRCYNIAAVTLKDYAVVSQRSFLCTASHDIRCKNFPLVSEEIVIHQNAWVAAEAFVGPGVEIGKSAVLGAKGCAFKCIPEGEVHGGNPAKKIGSRGTLLNPTDT
jgi:putative colanic acid biosynthesis acetyltransferase WcaF